MDEHSILVTGDYWHADFQALVSKLQVPQTLVPIENVNSVKDSKFDLIVIAQARRNQFSLTEIEQIQTLFANVPIAALLGSWCEGELRSGTPWPGVIRVYWHQWEGRYERFVNQLHSAGITDWHAPRTSTVADRIADGSSFEASHGDKTAYIAISAWTHWQHEMVADAVEHFGWHSRWVERSVWDGATSVLVSAICVEGDSWSVDLKNRLKWIREEIPDAPIVLLLNYPRRDELDLMHRAGVTEVVSKPFELGDLKSAIIRAVEKHAQANSWNQVAADPSS